jgi:5-methylcytosine-specific restriction endonuclease McrA
MFFLRNPEALRRVREYPSYRRAMKEHRLNHPECAYCGRSGSVHVHHIVPVSVDPSLASDPDNLLTLCAKRCHITIGHKGSWKTHNPWARTVCYLTRGKKS